MELSRIVMRLARNPGTEFAGGDDHRGYALTAPLLSWMVRHTPNQMTTSEQLGRAMIKVARDGYPKPILESADINAV